ncbi:hypothetical protein P8452_54483 [Trifolium repens]|nr:hypothetical protein P8452_54483 [Trifolium repens]
MGRIFVRDDLEGPFYGCDHCGTPVALESDFNGYWIYVGDTLKEMQFDKLVNIFMDSNEFEDPWKPNIVLTYRDVHCVQCCALLGKISVGFSAEWYNSKIGKFEILRKNLVFNGDNERE